MSELTISFKRALTDKEKQHLSKAISQLCKITAKSNEFDALISLLVNLIKTGA